MESNNQPPYNNYPPSYPIIEKPINWRKYIYLFVSNWYWFLITIFIAMSVAYLKNRYSLPVYRSSATLLLEDEEGSSDLLGELRSIRRSRRAVDLANEIAKLNAFSLHRRTIESLGWDIFWTGLGRVAMERPLYKNPPYYIETDSTSKTWYLNQTFFVEQPDSSRIRLFNKNGIDVILNLDEWNDLHGWIFRIRRSDFSPSYTSHSFVIYSPNLLTQKYRSKTNYESDEEKSSIIMVSSQGPVIERENDYINALCENYIHTGLERKRLIAENTLEFIQDQILIIQDSLQKTEKQLLAFRINKNAIDLSREGEIAYDKLQKIYDQKTQLQLKKNYYEYLKEYILNKRDPQAIISPTLIDANDQLLITQVQNLQQLYEEREQLEFSAALENPGVIQINARIQTIRNKVLDILDGLIHSNSLSWQQIDTEERSIEQQLLSLPVSEQELVNIQRKYDVNKQFYTFLLEKRTEAGIQKASTVSNVRILDSANNFNIIGIGTKKSTLYFIALLLGLMIPGGIIYLADSLDNRVKDRSDIEEKTRLPILGVVSHDASGADIPVFTNPGSPFTESFRHIRTNLQYILREPERKIIMVTSTISGEGKTFIVINLAAILAMNNKKVLIAGFDLRRPSMHRIFNMSNDVGISTYLAGNVKVEEIIMPTNVNRLDVMVAGPVPPNPAELIETKKTEELFKKVSADYDYILIDTPPVALVTDSILISKYAHSNIFIIRQNYSHKGVLEMINNLNESKIKEISLLINDIRESKILGYRYYYGYGYEYGYSYGYQSKYGYDYYHDKSKKST
jgi:capsular exopolysaccharide synthesis family protein